MKNNHRLPAATPLAAALALVLSAPAFAAPAPKELESVEVVGSRATKVSTATRTDTAPLDVPQSLSAVGQKELEERNVTSLNEALQTVAGVSPALGEGRRDQANIRGFSALNDQYLDGLRDDAPYYRDLANTERLEVLKGPAGVLYGRGSGGGLINRVSKKPEFDDTIRRFSLAAGSYGFLRATLDVGDHAADNDAAWRVNAAIEDSDSFRAHGYNQRSLLAPAVRWKLGDGVLTAQAELLHDERVPDRGIPGLDGRPAPVDIDTYYGDPERDIFETRAGEARLAYESGRIGRWTVRNALVLQRVDSEFYNTFVNGLTAANTRAARGQYDSATDNDSVFDQFEVMGRFGDGAVRHVLLAGVEWGEQQRTTLRNTGSAASVDLFDPDTSVGSTRGAVTTDNEFTGSTLAAYVQDQVDLGSHWKALFGLRWDRYGQRLENFLPSSTPVLERRDTGLSPRLGLVYKPVAAHSLYAAWSRSFQPSGDGMSLAVNTEELEPERSALQELGWKAEWLDGRIGSTLAVFEQVRDNLRTTDPLNPGRLVQVGEQSTRGVEFELSGRLTERLDLRLAYAHLDARITASNDSSGGVALQGNRPANVPENSGSLWGLFDLGGGFDIGLGVVAAGMRYSANDNLVRLPGYVRADALLRWRNERHELALNLKNLGDTLYYETAHTTHQIMPGAPRSAMLTWRLDY
jgi:catecholate siderophore receptor